jgi:hypothetical protein
VVSQVHHFGPSQVHDLRGFADSRFQGLGSSQVRDFGASQIQDSRSFTGSRFLKTHFTNFVKLDVSRVTGFPKFPNMREYGWIWICVEFV